MKKTGGQKSRDRGPLNRLRHLNGLDPHDEPGNVADGLGGDGDGGDGCSTTLITIRRKAQQDDDDTVEHSTYIHY
jgi:hypothetical protein